MFHVWLKIYLNLFLEDEDSIFFVERFDGSSTTAVSVNVGPNYIKEKDVISAKQLDRLDLNALQSVELINKEKVCNLKLFLKFKNYFPLLYYVELVNLLNFKEYWILLITYYSTVLYIVWKNRTKLNTLLKIFKYFYLYIIEYS